MLVANQVRNAAERLDVQPGRTERSYNEKEETHRLAVYRIVRYRRGADAADQTELGDTWRAGMRNGHTKPDTRAATGFTLLNGFQHLSLVAAEALRKVASELSNNARLVTGRHRHDDLVRAEDLGQKHGVLWAGMRPKLIRVNRRCNALV